MRLMKVSEFQKRAFTEGSAPDAMTIRRKIRSGEIPGHIEQIASSCRYYVDWDAFQRQVEGAPDDEVVRRILETT